MPMEIVTGDKVFAVKPPQTPDYKSNNPLNRLMSVLETVELAAEREQYLLNSVQHLIAYDYLGYYGPSGDQWNVMDPRLQDNKGDFQKQNVCDFRCTDSRLARGWATVDDWTGPFLLVSYRGGPDSKLSAVAGNKLGDSIKVCLKVGGLTAPELLTVPYNPITNRYELEIWAYPGRDLHSKLDTRGVAAIDRGGLVCRTDIVQGLASDFAREGLDNRDMRTVSPANTMHPVLPLTVELAWTDSTATHWDSNGGSNYRYTFGMLYRGWDNFLQVGISESPHGGFGFLHFRNLLSNYFAFSNSNELGRDIMPWMFNADGVKNPAPGRERAMSVEYMDLHILKSTCGIGLHRHRDNQEIFFVTDGVGIMVFGDWCQFPDRDRCFEIRTLNPGSFTLVKPGQLHALFNVTDEDLSLLMFGGYD